MGKSSTEESLESKKNPEQGAKTEEDKKKDSKVNDKDDKNK